MRVACDDCDEDSKPPAALEASGINDPNAVIRSSRRAELIKAPRYIVWRTWPK